MLDRIQSDGIIITDRPGGDRASEDEFLLECLDTLQQGTDYVRPDRVALSVLATSSKLVRLLQVADVVTSCTLAMVSGEDTYAPPIFNNAIRPMLLSDPDRIGGIGLKIHPDYRYVNLYHWVLGDENHIRDGIGEPLPRDDRPYKIRPDIP